jgi:hypothetical protein
MGQRVYVLSTGTKANIVGIYSNIRQVRKNVKLLQPQEKPLLFEIRINEQPCQDFGIDVTRLLEEVPEKN